MAYPNPLGYWVSIPSPHPAHDTLADLEQKFGSFFEAFNLEDLHALLSYCAVESDDSGSWLLSENRKFSSEFRHALELIDKLEPNLQLGLVRFVAEIISERGSK